MQTSELPTEFVVIVSALTSDFDRFTRYQMSGILRATKQCHYFLHGREVTQADYILALVKRAMISCDFRNSEIPGERMKREKLSGMVTMLGVPVHFLAGRIVSAEDYETAIYGEVLQLTRYFEANFNTEATH